VKSENLKRLKKVLFILKGGVAVALLVIAGQAIYCILNPMSDYRQSLTVFALVLTVTICPIPSMITSILKSEQEKIE